MPRCTFTPRCGTSENLIGVVRFGKNCFRQILAHFGFIDIEGGGEFDVTDVITAQIDVHQPGHGFPFLGILVKFNSLDQ